MGVCFLSAASVITGCSESGGGSAVDAGAPQDCIGSQACDGHVLRACQNGKLGAIVQDCAPLTCAANQCTPTACAAADRDEHGLAGCLFYTLIPENVASDADKTASFAIANPGTVTASVAVQTLAPAGAGNPSGWSNARSTDVPPAGAARLAAPGAVVSESGISPGAAVRVVSDQPVTVIQVQSDDDALDAKSSAGSMLLPVRMLGGHYRVVTYPQIATDSVAAVDGSHGGAGRLMIVGTRDQTIVTLQMAPNGVTAPAGDMPALFGGNSQTFTLDDGAVFQVYSGGEGADLTGSEIVADQPVAVFSGNISTSYGRSTVSTPEMPTVNSPDMTHEQLPRVGAWNATYVAAALSPQPGACDSLFGKNGGSLWRLLAGADGTEVRFDPGPGVVGLPSDPVTLGAGEVREMVVSGGSFTVTANPPVLLTQGMDCEPTLSLGVGVDRLLSDLQFSVLPNFDHLLVVVRRSSHPPVTLDDEVIADAAFRSAGSGYEVAEVTLPPCPPSLRVCAHHLAGEFAATIRGMDVVCSYAITAASWIGCVDHVDRTCVG